MTLSIFSFFHHGWFYRGAHRKFREQERSPRREKVENAFILLGIITCVVLMVVLAVLLSKGW